MKTIIQEIALSMSPELAKELTDLRVELASAEQEIHDLKLSISIGKDLETQLAAVQAERDALHGALIALRDACKDVLLPSINEAIKAGFKMETWTPGQMQWAKAVELTDAARSPAPDALQAAVIHGELTTLGQDAETGIARALVKVTEDELRNLKHAPMYQPVVIITQEHFAALSHVTAERDEWRMAHDACAAR